MAIWSRSKVFRLSKGYYKRSNNCFTIALRRVFKALKYQYRDRRVIKREVRINWIRSLNAGLREVNLNYSRFIYGLNRSNMMLDRKILAELVQNEPYSFKAVVDEVKEQVPIPYNHIEKITYQQALEKKMLHFGEYNAKMAKDIELKYAKLKNPNDEDWYGLNRPDFPTFYEEERKKWRKNQMPMHEMKKMKFTAYDDIPSEEDDN